MSGYIINVYKAAGELERMTPRQKLTEQVVREYADNLSMTLAGGLRIDDLRAAAQTDEGPFLLVRKLSRSAVAGRSKE